ncbi:MAG: histidine kinase N-terminal 7TM domain-containing protein [Bacteroidales bacterium]
MNAVSYLVLFNSCITGFLFLYSLRFRHTPGSRTFTLLMLAVTIYSFGYTFELSGQTYQVMRTWLSIEYAGISFIPALWLIFVLRYLRLNEWTTPFWLAVYLGISFVTLALNLTNSFHHLFYKDVQVSNQGAFPVLILTKGIWYWVHMIWFNLVVLISTILFINKLIGTPQLYRKQYQLMLLGTLAPWLTNTMYIAGLGPAGIDLNPFGAMITGLLFGWGIFFYQLFDVVPVALENVFSSMRDGVILLDRMKRILNFNPSARKIIGIISDRSIGNLLSKEIEDFPEYAGIQKVLESDTSDLPLVLNDPPGFFHLSLTPVKDAKTRIIGYLLMITDVTSQKVSEMSLLENEQALRELNTTKDKLLSIMAHDLRSPFNMIQSLVSLYQERDYLLNQQETAELLGYLHDASIHGSTILENMLLWTRAQTGKLEFKPMLLNFSKLAQEVLDGMKTAALKKNIRLKADIPTDSHILADKNMLGTVLRNLVMNAIKFTGEGGTVGLAFSERSEHFIIEVSDTGIGMEPTEIETLFSATATISKAGTHGEKGTGLGLLVCHEFIALHKGNIRVDSVPGKGSIFRITLPKPNLTQTQ